MAALDNINIGQILSGGSVNPGVYKNIIQQYKVRYLSKCTLSKGEQGGGVICRHSVLTYNILYTCTSISQPDIDSFDSFDSLPSNSWQSGSNALPHFLIFSSSHFRCLLRPYGLLLTAVTAPGRGRGLSRPQTLPARFIIRAGTYASCEADTLISGGF